MEEPDNIEEFISWVRSELVRMPMIPFNRLITKAKPYVQREERPFDTYALEVELQNAFEKRGVYIFYDVESAKPLYVGSAGADGPIGSNTLIKRLRPLLKLTDSRATGHVLARHLLHENWLKVAAKKGSGWEPIENQEDWQKFLKEKWALKIIPVKTARRAHLAESILLDLLRTPLNHENIIDLQDGGMTSFVELAGYKIGKD